MLSFNTHISARASFSHMQQLANVPIEFTEHKSINSCGWYQKRTLQRKLTCYYDVQFTLKTYGDISTCTKHSVTMKMFAALYQHVQRIVLIDELCHLHTLIKAHQR